jgi:lipopolysaccharide transport system ATP-binding protein
MIDRELQIGICGTFDVQNYGDLLFPLIAEAELSRRLGRVKLHPFSYSSKAPPDWPYAVRSLVDLPAEIGGLDGLVIGGGHLIRFDKDVAPGYGPPSPAIHHPTGYWLTPALIALQHGLPLAWNAPGVHGGIPAWAEPLMQVALGRSGYASVRDEPSRQALSRFAPTSGIAVVPDTAFGIGQLLDVDRPSPDMVRLRESVGLRDRYVVVQATRGLEAFARLVRDHPECFEGRQLVVVPIGPVLGDDIALLGDDLPGSIRLPSWPSPLLLAELIGHSSAVVGVSLHMAITALAMGVPVFRPAGVEEGGKYAVLSDFDTVEQFARETAIDPQWFAARIGRTAPAPAVRTAVARLSNHWDALALALGTGDGKPATLEALGWFWYSLPNLLEEWSVRQGGSAARGEAAAGARDGQLRALEGQLAAAQAAIGARDRQLAALQASKSWKITAPIRMLGRVLHRSERRPGRGMDE